MSTPQESKPKAGLWAFFAKLGSKVLPALGKMFKLSKVGFALASFAGYAVLYSWKFALLLMIAVGFHESGHVWAMKKTGMPTKGFYFLPFIGGAAIAEGEYKSYGQNAFISIMGPIWGAGMAWAAGLLYWTTGNPLWAAAAGWMAMLNLFNLLPITPLDGGQLVRSIAFSIHKNLGVVFLVLSFIAGGIIMWKLHIGLFVILLVIGALELFGELSRRIKAYKYRQGKLAPWMLPSSMWDENSPDKIKQYPTSMNGKELTLTILSYVGTTAVLVLLMKLVQHVPGADIAANFLE